MQSCNRLNASKDMSRTRVRHGEGDFFEIPLSQGEEENTLSQIHDARLVIFVSWGCAMCDRIIPSLRAVDTLGIISIASRTKTLSLFEIERSSHSDAGGGRNLCFEIKSLRGIVGEASLMV